jgi:hypothetical protein
MQPLRLRTGTYGCSRRRQPARTGGQHESVPQPRVVGRVARSGPRHLGHGCGARRRDRTPPRPEAARSHRLRSPAASARAEPGAVAFGVAGTFASTVAFGLAGTLARTVAFGLAGSGAVADPEEVALPGADAGGFAHARAFTKRFARAASLAREGSPQRSEPRGVH